MTKIEAAQRYKQLSEDERKIIKDIMMTTIDMCNDFLSEDTNIEPIYFPEAAAYKSCLYEMLAHYWSDEYYDFNKKKWMKYGTNN